MMKLFVPILISTLFTACNATEEKMNVGDIPFEKSLDDGQFKICNESNIRQYYVRYSSDVPPSYKGEKSTMVNAILNEYHFPITERENGYITIRFIVNCNGETGRFRMEEMDFNYKPKDFNRAITNQLLAIVKKLDGWVPRKSDGKNLDYYQYLTFKIEEGQIQKIMP